MGILERIADIEKEISRTQKNKATEYHLGILKARLAKLRQDLIESASSGKGGPREGFDVMKSGDSRVALIGFPSVGKSTLLCKMTKTTSIAAAYEFTTLTCIPGNIEYKGATIQLLDLPGIIEGASQSKGRGRQVIAVARTADLILMMLDSSQGEKQKLLLEKELETVGIRINKRPPDAYFKIKNGGGISFNATVPLTHMNDKLAYYILHEYKIHNCEILLREDITMDEFIDLIVGNRKYAKCLYVYNKIDQITIEEVDRLSRQSNSIVISSEQGWNLDRLVDAIWEALSLVRVFTKKRGEYPDFNDGLILRKGSSIDHVVSYPHVSIILKSLVSRHPQKPFEFFQICTCLGILARLIYVYSLIIVGPLNKASTSTSGPPSLYRR